jgi:cell division septation protein DedD
VTAVALAALALLLGYLWLGGSPVDQAPGRVATDVTIPGDTQSAERPTSAADAPGPAATPQTPTDTTTEEVEPVERPDGLTTSAPPAAPTSTSGSIPRAAPRGGRVSIQVAAYDREAPATALAARLAGDGLPAYILEARLPAGTVFRVRLGAYPNREAAETAGAQLRVSHDLDWFLVSTR